MVVAVVATLAGVLLLLSVVCCCLWRKRRRRHAETDTSAPSGGDDVLPFRTRKQQAMDENWKSAEQDVDDLPLFDLAVILAATDSFSASNKIGEGGFGPVYMVRNE